NYDLTLTATKTAGNEGFLVAFGLKDVDNWYWWNLGGWNNTQGAVEKASGGAKEQLFTRPDSITPGRAYNLKAEVRGTRVRLFVDGQLWGQFADDRVTEPFAQVVTQEGSTLIVKVVNAQDSPATTAIDLNGRKVAPRATMTVITGDPQAQNTGTARPIAPVTTTLTGVATTFTHTFPPNSVTFLRIRQR
ncbi:alpha-L-arabinofuranosidase C-terminal domain-containing protein, partial [Actinoplanes sp. NPDC089786]